MSKIYFKLEPCPFCDKKDLEFRVIELGLAGGASHVLAIYCRECGAMVYEPLADGVRIDEEDMNGLIHCWNKRVKKKK